MDKTNRDDEELNHQQEPERLIVTENETFGSYLKKVRNKFTVAIIAVVVVLFIAFITLNAIGNTITSIFVGQNSDVQVGVQSGTEGGISDTCTPLTGRLPENIQYTISATSFVLQDGRADVNMSKENDLTTVVSMVGSPVFGDLNDDQIDDAAIMLKHVDLTGEVGYYVVSAVFRKGLYEGTNAYYLGKDVTPDMLVIRAGIIMISHSGYDTGPDKSGYTSSDYLTVVGRGLHKTPPLYMTAELAREEGEYILYRCAIAGLIDRWIVEPAEGMAPLLDSYYEERVESGAEWHSVFMAVSGYDEWKTNEEEQLEKIFHLEHVLSAPRHGSCDAASAPYDIEQKDVIEFAP